MQCLIFLFPDTQDGLAVPKARRWEGRPQLSQNHQRSHGYVQDRVQSKNSIYTSRLDLSTLRSKVMNSQFRTLCDFVRDVNKIFNNCRQFNPINSTLSQCANVVDTCFRQLLEQLMIKDEHA